MLAKLTSAILANRRLFAALLVLTAPAFLIDFGWRSNAQSSDSGDQRALKTKQPIKVEQAEERIIEKLSWRTEPIKVLEVRTKGKPIELGKKFLEQDDWLTGLTVRVQNVSNKLIARIELSLSFPRPEGSSEEVPTLSEAMIYGEDLSASASDDQVRSLLVPGASAAVKLLAVNLSSIKTSLKTLGYPEKLTRARVMVDSVTFSDGTMWAGDDILYPSPDNPKQKFNPKLQTPPIPAVTTPPSAQSKIQLQLFSMHFQAATFRRTNAPS